MLRSENLQTSASLGATPRPRAGTCLVPFLRLGQAFPAAVAASPGLVQPAKLPPTAGSGQACPGGSAAGGILPGQSCSLGSISTRCFPTRCQLSRCLIQKAFLRISHWEEAIQETIGGEANRDLAAECYYLWKTTRLQHLTLAEDTRAMLTELRKSLRLLLLTNGDQQTQREKIEACACQPYFDAIVVGGEQKEEKPAPSIFHYCCDLLGVQPAECVMVGDSLDTDIQGGLNAGLKATVWINKTMTAPVDTTPVPHYIISSVLDLPAVLQKMEHNINAKLETDHMASSNEPH